MTYTERGPYKSDTSQASVFTSAFAFDYPFGFGLARWQEAALVFLDYTSCGVSSLKVRLVIISEVYTHKQYNGPFPRNVCSESLQFASDNRLNGMLELYWKTEA